MTKRSSKSEDMDKIAAGILSDAIGDPAPITPAGKRNPASVRNAREGGLEGGDATPAGNRSPVKRARSSKKAAATKATKR